MVRRDEEEDVITDLNGRPRRTVIFKIRQVLNLLFMLFGVVGGVMYSGLVGNDERTQMMGAVVAIVAVAMKMAECVLRCIKQ